MFPSIFEGDQCDWDGNQMYNCTFCDFYSYSPYPELSYCDYLRWELLPNSLRGELCPCCDKEKISRLYNKSVYLKMRLLTQKIKDSIKRCLV